MPAQVLMDWCCYFWDFKKKTIHVIDPLFKEDTREFYEKKHAGVVDRIGAELAKCIGMFFENWEVNWEQWRTEYVVIPVSNTSRYYRFPSDFIKFGLHTMFSHIISSQNTISNETGLQSLLSIREFDGDGFRNFAKVITFEVLFINKPIATL